MSKKILIVVVTYNRLELLKENLKSLLKPNDINFDILIIDNNSTDGTEKYLKNLKNEQIKIITTDKNIGGAGGFNLGMKYAIENDYNYSWLMDDDTIVEENSLSELVKASKYLKDNFSFLCSYVSWIDGTLCKMNIPKINTNFLEENILYLKNGIIEVESCSFVSCFINLKNVKKYGLPIKEFFIYYDDTEYTYRISRDIKGYLVVNSVVLHKMKSNISTNIEELRDINKIKRIKYDFRNGYYFYKKIGIKKIIRYWTRFFYHIFKISFSKSKYKLVKIYEMTKGMILGIFFNPKIEILKGDSNED